MRTLALYISLIFFLLIGKPSGYANTAHYNPQQSSSQTFTYNPNSKFENKSVSNFIIENADFDIEEDQLSSDKLNTHNQYTQAVCLEAQYTNWYRVFCRCFIDNQNLQQYHTNPVCISANPIYITQRVLRI